MRYVNRDFWGLFQKTFFLIVFVKFHVSVNNWISPIYAEIYGQNVAISYWCITYGNKKLFGTGPKKSSLRIKILKRNFGRPCLGTHQNDEKSQWWLGGRLSWNSYKWILQPVWPDWAIYCTSGNFSKPVATIISPKLPTFFGIL